jgi:ribonuclease PH
LIETGNTKVVCNVSIENVVSPFLKDTGRGWVTAEYSMLPGATKVRTKREVNSGKVSGRTAEIQRFIGRSLRSVIDMEKMDGYTATVDCEVIQADGGTRTAAITGAALALFLSFEKYVTQGIFTENPMAEMIAAVSVGVCEGKVVVDLDYDLDSNAEVDMNVVMTESGRYVEIQGTGEKATFSKEQLAEMLASAETTIQSLISYQKSIIMDSRANSVCP